MKMSVLVEKTNHLSLSCHIASVHQSSHDTDFFLKKDLNSGSIQKRMEIKMTLGKWILSNFLHQDQACFTSADVVGVQS